MRKKAENVEAALALLQAQKKMELSLLGEQIAVLETKLAEDSLAAQGKINDLEVKLAAANARSKKAIQNHLDIQNELSAMKVRAELHLKALDVKLSHLIEEAGAQYSRAEDLLKSNLEVRVKFCRPKEQLCKYKEEARSFYRQLTFASWAQDLSFSVGHMGGIETFWAWVRKIGNFSKVETIYAEELLPLKDFTEDAQTIE